MPKRAEKPEAIHPDAELRRTANDEEGVEDLDLARGDADAVKGGFRPRYQVKLDEARGTNSP